MILQKEDKSNLDRNIKSSNSLADFNLKYNLVEVPAVGVLAWLLSFDKAPWFLSRWIPSTVFKTTIVILLIVFCVCFYAATKFTIWKQSTIIQVQKDTITELEEKVNALNTKVSSLTTDTQKIFYSSSQIGTRQDKTTFRQSFF